MGRGRPPSRLSVTDCHDGRLCHYRMLDAVKPGGRIAIMDFQATRLDRGPLRWLYPLYSGILRLAGIDSKEDLDDAKLRAKWARGKALLRSRLSDITEESYLQGLGLLIAGTVR